MPSIVNIKPDTIQRMAVEYCKGRELKYMTDDDGDIVLLLSDSDLGIKYQINVIAGGQKHEILYVRAVFDKEVEPRSASTARVLCDEHNRNKRWPKAFVRSTPTSRGNYDIVMEEQIDLELGVHKELFDDFITTVMLSIQSFGKWLIEEKGFQLI